MSTEDEISQPLTPEEPFQRVFGMRLTEIDFEKRNKSKKKHVPTPTTLKELRMAYDKLDCTELTRFLWKRVENHEKSNGKFKGTGEMYSWIRKKVKTEILYEQSVTSRMKTAGKEYCSLCMAERVNIFCHMSDSEKSKKLMNKKSEMTGKCSCNARFLRLYLRGRGGC